MASKKTYTINITYTTKSPHEKFASPQENNKTRYNNSTSSFGMNNSYSKPSSNWQGNSGTEKTKSILKAHPSDYQGFTFEMNDTRPSYCKSSNFNGYDFSKKSNFDDHSKQNRRVRLFLDGEQTAI